MPTHVQHFFESAAAQGFSLEQIYDEARVRLADSMSPSLLDPVEPDSAETLLSDGTSRLVDHTDRPAEHAQDRKSVV